MCASVLLTALNFKIGRYKNILLLNAVATQSEPPWILRCNVTIGSLELAKIHLHTVLPAISRQAERLAAIRSSQIRFLEFTIVFHSLQVTDPVEPLALASPMILGSAKSSSNSLFFLIFQLPSFTHNIIQ